MSAVKKKRGRRSALLPSISAILIIAAISIILGFIIGDLIEKGEKKMYPKKYAEYVSICSEKYSVPEEIIYAVIRTESGFDPWAESHAGAIGLMQITPDTYDWLLFKRGEEKVSELTDPYTSIEFGTYFLSYLYNKFGAWDTAFAAYNAGMNRVSEWLCDARYSKDGKLTNIPYPETESYVKKVNNAINKYQKIYDINRKETNHE